jgi:hypothetical protein
VTQLALDACGPTQDREVHSQHFTPPLLADRLVTWAAHLSGYRASTGVWRTLEPSAGSGSFVAPMLSTWGHVTAHEIDPGWAGHLRDRHTLDVDVVEGDYMAAPAPSEPYHIACLNPPYEDGLDGQFVGKAMDESTRVLALVRLNFLAGADRFDRVWSRIGTDVDPGDWWCGGVVTFINRPRFSGAKGSAKSDFCAVYLTRDPHELGRACRMDWWRP